MNYFKSEVDIGFLFYFFLCIIFYIVDREFLEGCYCCKSFFKEVEEINFKGIFIFNLFLISEFFCYFLLVRMLEKNFLVFMLFVFLFFFLEEYEDDVFCLIFLEIFI